jgi:hypothetical protein
MGDEVCRGVLLTALALVKDDNHLYAPLLGIDECLGYEAYA